MLGAVMVEFYQSDLDVLRLLLTAAGVLLAVWWIAQLRAERPDKPKVSTFCKLHQRTSDLCRDMHDPEP